ncbi:unnamed protein product [Camellia sinensis]
MKGPIRMHTKVLHITIRKSPCGEGPTMTLTMMSLKPGSNTIVQVQNPRNVPNIISMTIIMFHQF